VLALVPEKIEESALVTGVTNLVVLEVWGALGA
jgi:hypothetical protein